MWVQGQLQRDSGPWSQPLWTGVGSGQGMATLKASHLGSPGAAPTEQQL